MPKDYKKDLSKIPSLEDIILKKSYKNNLIDNKKGLGRPDFVSYVQKLYDQDIIKKYSEINPKEEGNDADIYEFRKKDDGIPSIPDKTGKKGFLSKIRDVINHPYAAMGVIPAIGIAYGGVLYNAMQANNLESMAIAAGFGITSLATAAYGYYKNAIDYVPKPKKQNDYSIGKKLMEWGKKKKQSLIDTSNKAVKGVTKAINHANLYISTTAIGAGSIAAGYSLMDKYDKPEFIIPAVAAVAIALTATEIKLYLNINDKISKWQ